MGEVCRGEEVLVEKPESSQQKNKKVTVDAPEKFKGLLKMPFKKSKKRVEKEAKIDSDEDLDLEVSSSEIVDTSAVETPAEESSMTSMTDEWAKFHENSECGENSISEVETSRTEEEKTPKGKKKSKEEK